MSNVYDLWLMFADKTGSGISIIIQVTAVVLGQILNQIILSL